MTFSLHFSLLAIAVGLIAVMSFAAPWMLDPYAYVTFAMSGSLHAMTIAGAVRVERRWGLRIGFVVGAAILSCMAPQAGIFVSQLAGIESFLGLIACISAIGALLYALLIKACWLRTLSLFAVIGIATVCAVTSSAVFMLAGSSMHLQAALITCWWIAFSVALSVFARTREPRFDRLTHRASGSSGDRQATSPSLNGEAIEPSGSHRPPQPPA